MCPDPIVFFHNPKWTLPVPLITLGRTASFHRGARTKEALPCPSPSGPKITEKVPGKEEKKNPAQPAQSHERKEQCLNRWDGWTDKQTYSTVKPRTFTQIGSQSKSANRAAWCDEQVRKLLMDLSGLQILSCTTRDVWRMDYFFDFIPVVWAGKGFLKHCKNRY